MGRLTRDEVWSFAGPAVVAIAVGVLAEVVAPDRQLQIQNTMVLTAMVVALGVFSGNSGVVSFGHISFVAVGAFAAAVLSVDPQLKENVYPDMFDVLRNADVGNLGSLLAAALIGGIFALVVGLALMRLDGLAAGIATFAVLGITRNVIRNWEGIGPGPKRLSAIPETTGFVQATVGLLLVMFVAWVYARSRWGRRLKATREDPQAAASVGISVYRERLIAFVLSGMLSGFAGGLYVHLLGSVQIEQVYLDLTFLTLAMLVIGGIGSMWGALVGGLVLGLVNTLLAEGEQTGLFGVDIPSGSRTIVIGVLMAVMLLLRPAGLTGGREFSISRPGRAIG